MVLEIPSLLITDDDRDLRETLREVFEPFGLRTLLAADGGEALEILQNEQIHVVLLDMHMPRLTGLETIREVRRLQVFVPFILISAGLDESILAEARREQVFSVLPKPFRSGEITAVVQQALRVTYDWQPTT